MLRGHQRRPRSRCLSVPESYCAVCWASRAPTVDNVARISAMTDIELRGRMCLCCTGARRSCDSAHAPTAPVLDVSFDPSNKVCPPVCLCICMCVCVCVWSVGVVGTLQLHVMSAGYDIQHALYMLLISIKKAWSSLRKDWSDSQYFAVDHSTWRARQRRC